MDDGDGNDDDDDDDRCSDVPDKDSPRQNLRGQHEHR